MTDIFSQEFRDLEDEDKVVHLIFRSTNITNYEFTWSKDIHEKVCDFVRRLNTIYVLEKLIEDKLVKIGVDETGKPAYQLTTDLNNITNNMKLDEVIENNKKNSQEQDKENELFKKEQRDAYVRYQELIQEILLHFKDWKNKKN
jgi:hypothetical protein